MSIREQTSTIDTILEKLDVVKTCVQGKQGTKFTKTLAVLHELVSKLDTEHKTKTEELIKYKKENAELKDKLKKIQTIGKHTADKLISSTALMQSLSSYLGQPQQFGGVHGSFIRQWFELPFALKEMFKTQGYGQSAGHDIDIHLFETHDVGITHIKQIEKMAKDIETYVMLYNASPDTIAPLKFGSHTIEEFVDVTLTKCSDMDPIGKKLLVGIPHFVLYAVDDERNEIKFDILGWLPEDGTLWPNTDFDVNSLRLTEHGIESDSDSLLNIIHRISKKEAVCYVNLKGIQECALMSALKKDKAHHFSQIGFFFKNRLKVMSYGYNTISSIRKFPEFEIEEKENCYVLTGCQPPYINLLLKCGHKISLMAFTGLINETDEYKQSILCPLCRKQLELKMSERKVSAIENVKFDIKNIIKSKTRTKQIKETSLTLLSETSIDALNELATPAAEKPVDEVEPEHVIDWQS